MQKKQPDPNPDDLDSPEVAELALENQEKHKERKPD